MKSKLSLAFFLCGLAACNSGGADSPTSPSTAATASPTGIVAKSAGLGALSTSMAPPFSLSPAVVFPDRSEPFRFRVELEDVYRGLGFPLTETYVNIEGAVIWISEYLRYRLSACTHQDAINRVFFGIDNLTTPPLPECGGNAPFPDRQEPFNFRVAALEPKYRDGLRMPIQRLYVNAEGDVIWTMEYLRYRVGACSHTEATNKVILDIRGGGPQPLCTGGTTHPNPPPQAAFDVIPDPGTTVNAPQCAVKSATVGGNPRNQLLCTFDARGSTPRGSITSYRWAFEGGDSETANSGDQLRNPALPCGQFPGTALATEKTVTLTVTSPGGNNSLPKRVTFVKQGPC
ncbi:MAG: hypothetical protein ACRD2N_05620 [Vicinamibacterales bacterium]